MENVTTMSSIQNYENSATGVPLDLYSTSQKTCASNPPNIAYPDRNNSSFWFLLQGNCHNWLCPRCGYYRAKKEYGRVVSGAELLESQGKTLYFLTLTTRGTGLSIKQAHSDYLLWTNRLFSAMRADARKRNVPWNYCQITEYQKRGHPHSHILTTYYPDDLTPGYRPDYYTDASGRKRKTWVEITTSPWMQKRIESAGMGKIWDISEVENAAAASRYVSKYMFKGCMMQPFPSGWKRIRYSQSWPNLLEKNPDAIALLDRSDWQKLSRLARVVAPENKRTFDDAMYYLRGSDMLIRTPE